jgi:hypothetical protein
MAAAGGSAQHLDLLERATDLRADATRHLTALAGDASMCAIGRSGRSFPAAKYHEGRQAAASEVRRALRRDPGAHVLAGITDVWTTRADEASEKGPDWVAYFAGGLDALAELAASGPPTLASES